MFRCLHVDAADALRGCQLCLARHAARGLLGALHDGVVPQVFRMLPLHREVPRAQPEQDDCHDDDALDLGPEGVQRQEGPMERDHEALPEGERPVVDAEDAVQPSLQYHPDVVATPVPLDVVELLVGVLVVDGHVVVALVVLGPVGHEPVDVHVGRLRDVEGHPRARRRLHGRQEGHDGEGVTLPEAQRSAAAGGAPVVGEDAAAPRVHKVQVGHPRFASQRRPARLARGPRGRAGGVPALGGLRKVSEQELLGRVEVLKAEVVQRQGLVGEPGPEHGVVKPEVLGWRVEEEGLVEHGVVTVQLVPCHLPITDMRPSVPIEGPSRGVDGEHEHIRALVAVEVVPRAHHEDLRERLHGLRPWEPTQHDLIPPCHWLGVLGPHIVDLTLEIERLRQDLRVAVRRLLEEAIDAAVPVIALVVPVLLDNKVGDVALLGVRSDHAPLAALLGHDPRRRRDVDVVDVDGRMPNDAHVRVDWPRE
mmetsp:Transcript_90935/g.283314  ORF Transcript_90935/g.283314 Transcript_90935/m.283314 type:complete len:478 (-) Transcript_90935:505-1938(-)